MLVMIASAIAVINTSTLAAASDSGQISGKSSDYGTDQLGKSASTDTIVGGLWTQFANYKTVAIGTLLGIAFLLSRAHIKSGLRFAPHFSKEAHEFCKKVNEHSSMLGRKTISRQRMSDEDRRLCFQMCLRSYMPMEPTFKYRKRVLSHDNADAYMIDNRTQTYRSDADHSIRVQSVPSTLQLPSSFLP